jgi:hypothetical protein
MRGVHPVHAEGRGRVLHQRDVVPELHRESAGGFDARVASRPITMTLAIPCFFSSMSRSVFAKLLDPQCSLTTIARLRREIRMPFAAPAPFGEHLPLDRLE